MSSRSARRHPGLSHGGGWPCFTIFDLRVQVGDIEARHEDEVSRCPVDLDDLPNGPRLQLLMIAPGARPQEPGAERRRGEEIVFLNPLPCWSHLPVEEQRSRAAALVREIEEEARISEGGDGLKPLGVAAVLTQDPTRRPEKLKKSPAPFVHAATKAMRQQLWEAYAWFVAAYRDAAEKLRAGDPDPPFPPGCFPPALPFVAA